MGVKIVYLFTTIFADGRATIFNVIILILIISILASCLFIYAIERKKTIRRRNRRENNKGKFTYLVSILKEEE